MNRIKMFIASGAVVMSLLACGISSQAAPETGTISVKAYKPSTQSGTTGSKASKKTTVTNKKYKYWSTTGTYTGEWSNSMPNGKGTFTFLTENVDGDYSDFRFIPINLSKDHFHETSIQVCRNNYSNNLVQAGR